MEIKEQVKNKTLGEVHTQVVQALTQEEREQSATLIGELADFLNTKHLRRAITHHAMLMMIIGTESQL